MSNVLSEQLPPSLAFSTHRSQVLASMQWHRLQVQNHERVFNSNSVHVQEGDDEGRSQVNFSGRLPSWLWVVIATMLGIGPNNRKWRVVIAATFKILTVLSAFLFAGCGLVFNTFDVLSQLTKTTVLVGICKCVLGAYWMGMGIYAHSLAGRLFSNVRFMDCIRMHSKTIFKLNAAIIIMMLSVMALASNLYWTRNLLNSRNTTGATNGTKVRDADCVKAKIDVRLCQIYYGTRLVYSVLTLLWNLMVAIILLSVCRTHTICIRRFMKELLLDTKIFEEFLMLQAFEARPSFVEASGQQSDATKGRAAILESHIWDDDIKYFERDSDDDLGAEGVEVHGNAHILQSMRHRTFDSSAFPASYGRSINIFGSSQGLERSHNPPLQAYVAAEDPSYGAPHFPQDFSVNGDDEELLDNDASSNPFPFEQYASARAEPTTRQRLTSKDRRQCENSYNNSFAASRTGSADESSPDRPANRERFESSVQSEQTSEDCGGVGRSHLLKGKAPILSNENLLFTYFQLVRRLASTSRLLQRWMSTLITFILLWCTLLIIYWTTHEADWLGLFEFLVPLAVLFLLSSAYAEVNFEGERLLKCVLPTPERMAIVYYMQTVPLELKVFSFSLSYNTIMTVVAGVAVTFATRIILEQAGFGN